MPRSIALAAAALATALPTCALAASQAPLILIQNDNGGSIAQFDRRARAWARQGAVVVIDGACASACTRYAYAKWHLKVCGTANARLLFHKPYNISTETGRADQNAADARMAEIVWKRDWLAHMTPDQRAFFKGRHVPSPAAGEDQSTTVDSGASTGLFLKPCSAVLRGDALDRPVITVNGTSDSLDSSSGSFLLKRV